MQTVYARVGAAGGSGSQQREVADGADVHRLVTMFMQLPVYEIWVRLKVEIHQIHQNLRNPVSILSKFHALQQNPLT